MTFEPTLEDIVAAREQGDLKALLLLAAGLSPAPPPSAEPEPEVRLHRERVGAWPSALRMTPDPLPTIHPAHIEKALADYRAWELAGRPPCDTRCDCPACQPNGAPQ